MSRGYGWTGTTLCVDLSSRAVTHLDTMQYVPQLIGGLGVAAGIAWDTLRPGIDAFSPENPLMIMAGPLTGTLASGAGRVTVAGIAPQQRPSRFSRSGMGGHWGPELKYAGYDGLVVVGVADGPVYLWIHDSTVEILDATDLWGRGTFATTSTLRSRHGQAVRVVACGPAGERKARIAAIQTETGNAAGQGGYGALMGSKNLKAVAVRGTGGVRLAHPRAFLDLCRNASTEGFTPSRHTARDRSGPSYRTRKCGFCMTPCVHPIYTHRDADPDGSPTTTARQCYGFVTSDRSDQSARALASDLGLNGWEVAYGIIPWLQMCKQEGLIDAIDGFDIPVPEAPILYLKDAPSTTPAFQRMLLKKIAARQGELGDALADGACHAADRLFGGKGQHLLDPIYPRRAGQTGHWDAHWGAGGTLHWPYWLVTVLQWFVDTRDPASDSSHSWTGHSVPYLTGQTPLASEKVRAVAEKMYGRPDVGDPTLEYEPHEARTRPAIWHHLRGMLIDSLILCDYEHARMFSMLTEDGQADTAIMAKLLSAATGIETSEAELDRSSERVFQTLRAIDVRDHGRSRQVDESSMNAYRLPDKDDGVPIDEAQFLRLLQSYYGEIGWNPANGWPTRDRLEGLGLTSVADGLAAANKLG